MLDFVKNMFKKSPKAGCCGGHDVLKIDAYAMAADEGAEEQGGCCGGHGQAAHAHGHDHAHEAHGGCCGGAHKKAEEKQQGGCASHGGCGCH